MKKELGIAIFIGVLLGFGLSALVWTIDTEKKPLDQIANKSSLATQNENENEIIPVDDQKIDPIEAENKIFLNITHPENEIISSRPNLIVSGETIANATVVIIWEKEQDILVADREGNFETEINLIGGENKIKVTAYDNQGNSSAQTLTITYSTAKF